MIFSFSSLDIMFCSNNIFVCAIEPKMSYLYKTQSNESEELKSFVFLSRDFENLEPQSCFVDSICYTSSFTLFFLLTSALTFKGRPKRFIKPSASLWLYNSPVVKLANDSLYNEYGDFAPAGIMFPL